MQNMSPIGWALRPLKNYAKFSGRASRAEFWWFFLFLMIFYAVVWIGLFMMIGITAFVAPAANPSPFAMIGAMGIFGIFLVLFWLALIIPTIAVQVRRLHDTDRSGWWLGAFWLLYLLYMGSSFAIAFSAGGSQGSQPSLARVAAMGLIALVFFVYSIVLLVFWCLQGTKAANRFGEDPYGPDVQQVFA